MAVDDTQWDPADTDTVYRHVFDETGCADSPFNAKLEFSNYAVTTSNVPGVWAETGERASGCKLVRLLVKHDTAEPLSITAIEIETAGCPPGQWKDAGVCKVQGWQGALSDRAR